MIICILQNQDKENVIKALNELGVIVTVLPSTGPYFRKGYATLMIGVEENAVDNVIQTIKDNCSKSDNPQLKRATLFVMNVSRFEQI